MNCDASVATQRDGHGKGDQFPGLRIELRRLRAGLAQRAITADDSDGPFGVTMSFRSGPGRSDLVKSCGVL